MTQFNGLPSKGVSAGLLARIHDVLDVFVDYEDFTNYSNYSDFPKKDDTKNSVELNYQLQLRYYIEQYYLWLLYFFYGGGVKIQGCHS